MHVVFGVFGGLSPDKRVAEILRAFAQNRRRAPRSICCWPVPPTGASTRAHSPRRCRSRMRVTLAGVLDDAAFDGRSPPWTSASTFGGRPPSRPRAPGCAPWPAGRPSSRPRWPIRRTCPRSIPATGCATIPGRPGAGDGRHRSSSTRTTRSGWPWIGSRPIRPPRCASARSARHYWEAEHTLERMADEYEASCSPRDQPAAAVRRSSRHAQARAVAPRERSRGAVWRCDMRITLNGDPTDLPDRCRFRHSSIGSASTDASWPSSATWWSCGARIRRHEYPGRRRNRNREVRRGRHRLRAPPAGLSQGLHVARERVLPVGIGTPAATSFAFDSAAKSGRGARSVGIGHPHLFDHARQAGPTRRASSRASAAQFVQPLFTQ